MKKNYEKIEQDLATALENIERQKLWEEAGGEGKQDYLILFTPEQKISLTVHLQMLVKKLGPSGALLSQEQQALLRGSQSHLLEQPDLTLRNLYRTIITLLPKNQDSDEEVIKKQKKEHQHKNLMKHQRWIKAD